MTAHRQGFTGPPDTTGGPFFLAAASSLQPAKARGAVLHRVACCCALLRRQPRLLFKQYGACLAGGSWRRRFRGPHFNRQHRVTLCFGRPGDVQRCPGVVDQQLQQFAAGHERESRLGSGPVERAGYPPEVQPAGWFARCIFVDFAHVSSTAGQRRASALHLITGCFCGYKPRMELGRAQPVHFLTRLGGFYPCQ